MIREIKISNRNEVFVELKNYEFLSKKIKEEILLLLCSAH